MSILAISNEIDEYHNIDAPIISDDGKIRSQRIPKAMLTAMIKPRIEEIFDGAFGWAHEHGTGLGPTL